MGANRCKQRNRLILKQIVARRISVRNPENAALRPKKRTRNLFQSFAQLADKYLSSFANFEVRWWELRVSQVNSIYILLEL